MNPETQEKLDDLLEELRWNETNGLIPTQRKVAGKVADKLEEILTDKSEADNLIHKLLETDGVSEVNVESRIKVSVARVNTGLEVENYQPIRERVVSEEEMEEIAGDEWNYSENINDKGDFRTVDSFVNRSTYEEEP